jgi:ribosome maturation factor RimP
MGSLYRQDVYLWSREQSAALRKAADAGSNLPIDWENVAEEIESVGNSERLTLSSHIARIVEHLMKLDASPAHDPRRGWISTIIDAQREIEDVLESSPSLRREIPAIIAKQIPRVRRSVGIKLKLYQETPTVDLEALSYSEEQVLAWHSDA